MRLNLPSVIVSVVLLASSGCVFAEPSSEAPNLRSIVSRANVLLSAGQFHDAAKSLSEAIELSPADYSLYFKRATAYYSLNRHSQAMDDFDTVLRMTEGSFHQALLMKAKLYTKDGDWAKARDQVKLFTNKVGKGDKDAVDLVSTKYHYTNTHFILTGP